MEINSPGRGIMAKRTGVVTTVSGSEIKVDDMTYQLIKRDEENINYDEGTFVFPTKDVWQESVVKVGDKVAKKQLLAKGVTRIFFQANVWIFAVLVILIGSIWGVGKAGVYKSIPALLLAFAVWIMWSVIATKMKEFGYNFGMITANMSPEEITEKLKDINSLYYTLPAIAGLAGATLRIPNSFLIGIGGGRNVIFISTVLLLIPAIGVGFALQDVNTPYLTFAIFAGLSGFGGGNFSSSMSNISYFFPKKVQGTSLGLNAGIGNLGVGVMQKTIPLVIGLFLFSAIDKNGNVVSGEALAGIQNAGWIWVPLLVISAIAAFFGMNNVITGTPKLPNTLQGVGKTLYMIILGLIAACVGAYLLVSLQINMWIVLPGVIILTVLLMKFATPGWPCFLGLTIFLYNNLYLIKNT